MPQRHPSPTSGTPAPVRTTTTYSAWTPSAFPATVTADFGGSRSFRLRRGLPEICVRQFTTLEYWNGSTWVAIGQLVSRDAGLHPVAVPQQIRREIRITWAAASDVAVIKILTHRHERSGSASPVGYEPALFNRLEKAWQLAPCVTRPKSWVRWGRGQRIDRALNLDLIGRTGSTTPTPIRLLIRDVGVFTSPYGIWRTSPRLSFTARSSTTEASYSQVDCMRLQLQLEGSKHVL